MAAKRSVEEWTALAAKFRPYVELCDTWVYKPEPRLFRDKYKPSSVEWYLQRCSLRDRADERLKLRAPSGADLLRHNKKTTYLHPEVDTWAGDMAGAPYYVTINPGSGSYGRVQLAYWFFYPYNGAVGDGMEPNTALFGYHEGDWEHVIVLLDQSDELEAVSFSAHGSQGAWIYDWSEGEPSLGRFQLVNGRPLVYSAWHSHASYPLAGLITRPDTAYAINDRTGEGPRWDGAVEVIAIDKSLLTKGSSFKEPDWARWVGRWGSTEDRWYNLYFSLSPDGPDLGPVPTPEWSNWSRLHRLFDGEQVTDAAMSLSAGGLLGIRYVCYDRKSKNYYALWLQQHSDGPWSDLTGTPEPETPQSAGISPVELTSPALARAGNQLLAWFAMRANSVDFKPQVFIDTSAGTRIVWGNSKNLPQTEPVTAFAVAADAEELLHVFTVGKSGALYESTQTEAVADADWAQPVRLPVNHTVKHVLAVERIDARIATVIETTDGSLLQGRVVDGTWQFVAMQKGFSPTTLVVNSDNRLEVFALDENGVIRHSFQHDGDNDASWSKWMALPDLRARKIAVATDRDGLLNMLAVGEQNVLHQAKQDASNDQTGWTAWKTIGDNVSNFWLGANVGGRLETIISRGNELHHRWQRE